MTPSSTDAPEHDYSQVLAAVYDAALSPPCWPHALELVAGWLGASRSLLFTPTSGLGETGFFYSHGVSAEEMTIWNSRYVGQDFWTQRAIERGLGHEGSIFRDHDLSVRQELLDSDYYREHLVRMDIGWLLSGVVLAPPDGSLPVVVLSNYRGIAAPAGFDETARARLSLLLPHLSRAVAVMTKLRAAEHRVAASAAALDALSCGVVLLDRRGRVVHANRRAASIWHAADGLGCDMHQQLRMEDRAAQMAWQAALQATLRGAESVAHFSEAVCVPRTSGAGSFLLQLSRLPSCSERFGAVAHAATAIAFITDSERLPEPGPTVLMRLYGLSAAEARTAQVLAGGTRLAEAAEALNLSTNTLKAQLKQVYLKTGCSSRAELARLTLSLATARA